MSLQTIINYSTPGNFSFDSSLIDLSSGAAKLKDQRPANVTAFAGFLADKNLDYGNGSATSTLGGAAAVDTANGLVSLAGDATWIKFLNTLNFDLTNTFMWRWQIMPLYTGVPAVPQFPGTQRLAFGNTTSGLEFKHQITNGNVGLVMYNSANANVYNVDLAQWLPVAGTWYEWLFIHDGVNGATKLLIDRSQLGSTQVSVFSRGSVAGGNFGFGFGINNDLYVGQNFKIRNVEVYNSITALSALTAVGAKDTQYSITTPPITVASATNMDELDDFVETGAVVAGSALKYQLKLGNVLKYWNGTAWATSDGTYAQSNTAAEIETNKAALDLSAGYAVKVVALLSSSTGRVTPTLTSVELEYSFFAFEPSEPAKCIVYGWTKKDDGTPDVGAIVTVSLATSFFINEFLVTKGKVTATADANGYYEIPLFVTAGLGATSADDPVVSISIKGAKKTKFDDVAIPNSVVALLSSFAKISTV